MVIAKMCCSNKLCFNLKFNLKSQVCYYLYMSLRDYMSFNGYQDYLLGLLNRNSPCLKSSNELSRSDGDFETLARKL